MKKIWMFVLLTLASGAVNAKESFELVGVSTPAGESHSYMATEGDISLPVTVVHGAHEGPVLLLTAGIHGDEFPAMFALQRLRSELDPNELRGTVILLHLANVHGFHGRRVALSPLDEKNLNRVFPGDKDGTPTEQVAELLTREFISRADFLVDMHSARSSGKLLEHVYSPFVGDEQLDNLTFEFARATGMKHIVMYGERPRDPDNSISYPNTAMTRGKPGLTTEIGQLGQRDEHFIEDALAVARNVIYFLEILPGQVAQHPNPVIYDRLIALESAHDGFFTPLAQVGDAVQAGDVVAEVTDYFGDVLQQLHAPESGTVLMINHTPPILSGETPVTIAIEQSR